MYFYSDKMYLKHLIRILRLIETEITDMNSVLLCQHFNKNFF